MLFFLQPPFLMDKWIVGLEQNQKIDYTVNFEASHFSTCLKTEYKTLESFVTVKIAY